MTFARWSVLQALYWLGVHPNTLARMYAHVRVAGSKRRGRGDTSKLVDNQARHDAGREEA
jgi:hypothetical protein